MSKIYLFLLFFCYTQISLAQCPTLDGAMVNSCAPNGPTEGNNEFVFFTTGAAGAVSLYELDYGSNNPATQSPTGILSGTNAAPKDGTGSIIVQGGCTLHEVTSPSTVIPANSRVVFIPSIFDIPYDLSALCNGGDLYVVYIDRSSAPTKWGTNGTLANGATTTRYLQLQYNGNACESGIRSYDASNWPLTGTAADGNSLAWDNLGNTLYLNNGCSVVIITPVKLISFNAIQKGKDVTVTWKTANEINAKQFEVEWSADGSSFTTIGTLNATGNSDITNSYSFTDKNITTGNNFYRLKTVDEDGRITYSPIVKVNFSGSSLVKVYPQLTSGNLTVELNALKQGETTALIFDHIGRLLSSKKISVVAGYNKLQLDVNNLPAGGYVLKLVNNSEINIARFTRL